MTTNAPFSIIKKIRLPKKASPAPPPKAPSPGIKPVPKESTEFNRALDEALNRHSSFDDLSEEYTFKAGFGEGFNAGIQYAKSLLDSITKEK